MPLVVFTFEEDSLISVPLLDSRVVFAGFELPVLLLSLLGLFICHYLSFCVLSSVTSHRISNPSWGRNKVEVIVGLSLFWTVFC